MSTCFTEEQDQLKRWTEYCSELNYIEIKGDPTVLNCCTDMEEDNYPILLEEVEPAIKSLKKGKSAGVDNIPGKLVQAGGEEVINFLTKICNKIWQSGKWPTPIFSHHTPQKRHSTAMTKL